MSEKIDAHTSGADSASVSRVTSRANSKVSSLNTSRDSSREAEYLKKAAKDSSPESKKQAFIVRTIWSLVMIVFFFAVLAAGHIWVIALVGLVQILTFKEVINLASEPASEKKLPWVRSLNWYFLATTIYFLEGENIIRFIKQNNSDLENTLNTLFLHHRFLSYCLYILGFVFFVASLEKNHYRFQFTQFCLTHMTLLFGVVQAHFIVNNIFQGLFWFFVPAGLVISNDIFAYLCGITFGKHQLIAISPKKTVEGFLGAWICTIIWGVIFSVFLYRFDYFICPVEDMGTNLFSNLTCVPNPVFMPKEYPIPTEFLRQLTHKTTFSAAPIHFHVGILASFASLVAPFGGFFASGLKRAFQVKDFGDTIPGHGGITDRMDCQFLMGFFSYLYYETFVSNHVSKVETLLNTLMFTFTRQQQEEFVRQFFEWAKNEGLLTGFCAALE